MVDIKRVPSDPDYASLHVPPWVPKVYPVLAVVLLPWTIYLGLSLPRHHLSAYWDVSWVGLDIGLILALSATGLLVDAWFDVMSERRPSEFHQELFLAIFIKLPLSTSKPCSLPQYCSAQTLNNYGPHTDQILK
jgi:hypothetical protein